MKQFFISSIIIVCIMSGIMLIGCNKQKESGDPAGKEYVSQFYSGEVLITITTGAELATKSSNDNIEYYTVTGQLNTAEYSMYVETNHEDSGFSINTVYSQEGIWLFTEVLYNGQLISLEFSDLEGFDDNEIETKASRHNGEGYIACVHRVHAKLKGAMEKNYPITCDFISCGAISAVCAIVECNEYGNDH